MRPPYCLCIPPKFLKLPMVCSMCMCVPLSLLGNGVFYAVRIESMQKRRLLLSADFPYVE
jgi:hypothetical protein